LRFPHFKSENPFPEASGRIINPAWHSSENQTGKDDFYHRNLGRSRIKALRFFGVSVLSLIDPEPKKVLGWRKSGQDVSVKKFPRAGEMGRPFKVFYGWYIVGICIISMTLIYGIRHSFAIFFSPILDEFGWSRGDIAMMLSLNIFVYGFLAPFAGALADRWRPRILIPGGILILGLATAGCAFAERLWHFYVLFGFLMSLGTAFSGWPIFAPALVNWFAERRGLVLGLGQMGGGLSFVYSLFVDFAIRHFGWRHAFLALAGLLVVTLLPLLVLLFFYRPEEAGMKPYGGDDLQGGKAAVPNARKAANLGPPLQGKLKEVLRTPRLWFWSPLMPFIGGLGDTSLWRIR
jgi:sugar phosphate permease